MNRHLLPNEIDLLVDGDVGFGVAPLRAHVDSCDECRERLSALRAVTARLDGLPHFTPRLGFSDRVMQQVQVIEPWHVALTESATRLVPQSVPMRIAAAAAAGIAAITISGSALWLAFRADLVAWSYGVAVDLGRAGVLATLSDLLATAFSSTGTGVATLGAAATAVATVTVAAIFGFRRLAATARSHQG